MLKRKTKRNNIIIILSILLIGICVFIKINDIYSKKNIMIKEEKIINNIIKNETTTISSDSTKKTSKQISEYNYVAILEIPKINLKKGLVKVTKNFKSINYAISIDSHSTFPDDIGNFILYAHSGNSRISYFDKLNNLEVKDEIKVYYNGVWYYYSIIKKYEVDKNGKLGIFNDNESKYITLTTCSQENKNKQIVILGKERK